MSDAASSPPPPPLNARVAARTDLNARLAIVRVAPEGWSLPPFEAGQFATLGLPDPNKPGALLKRVYSIVSAPGDAALEFYIQLVREGELTSRLWHLGAGDPLWLSERISGRFTLDGVPDGADLVLVSTGTGLAPFISFVRAFGGKGRWRHCAVVHGARSADELGYRDELTAHAGKGEIAYLPLLTREPPGSSWKGLRGRVQSLLQDDAFARHAGFPLDPARTHVYLCGNPAMIDDLEARLVKLGFKAPETLHFERWW